MILDNRDTIVYLAQETLAAWGDIIVTASIKKSRVYQEKAKTLRFYLHAIQYDYFLEESETISILQCINKLADLTDWPTAPILGEQSKPSIIVGEQGKDGAAGLDGINGTDANIDAISNPSYDNILIIESVVMGVKTFSFAYAPYTQPTITVSLTTAGFPNPSSYIQELGITVPSVPMVSTLNKGRENVITSEVITPIALDTAYQGLLNLTSLNAGNQQVITVTDTNVVATKTYTSNIADGTNTPSASRTLTFVIPFLKGSSANLLSQSTYYANLDKIIEQQGDKSVTFNGIDRYFYFIYDASYPDITIILDGNGFNVTSGFVATTENIDMRSGTESMKVLRTAITDIPNQIYQFKF